MDRAWPDYPTAARFVTRFHFWHDSSYKKYDALQADIGKANKTLLVKSTASDVEGLSNLIGIIIIIIKIVKIMLGTFQFTVNIRLEASTATTLGFGWIHAL